MDYDSEFVKKQLALRGIAASDQDARYVQRIMSIIEDGERKLEAFPGLEDEKIALVLDMEVPADD